MNNELISLSADKIYEAERSRTAIFPLERSLSVSGAYAVQMKNVERVLAAGHEISGKKIGLTSPGIQRQFGVSEPDYGHLFAAMDCADGIIDTSQLIQPKIEAELAFILKEDLYGGSVTAGDVIRASECVCGAFEIVDSRIADWKITLADTIADNASSGRYMLGDKKLTLGQFDSKNTAMKLYKNGELVHEGSSAEVLGDPCVSVAWLSNKLWSYGIALKAGEVILSGAFSAAPQAQKGDVFEAEFSFFGKIRAKFV